MVVRNDDLRESSAMAVSSFSSTTTATTTSSDAASVLVEVEVDVDAPAVEDSRERGGRSAGEMETFALRRAVDETTDREKAEATVVLLVVVVINVVVRAARNAVAILRFILCGAVLVTYFRQSDNITLERAGKRYKRDRREYVSLAIQTCCYEGIEFPQRWWRRGKIAI